MDRCVMETVLDEAFESIGRRRIVENRRIMIGIMWIDFDVPLWMCNLNNCCSAWLDWQMDVSCWSCKVESAIEITVSTTSYTISWATISFATAQWMCNSLRLSQKRRPRHQNYLISSGTVNADSKQICLQFEGQFNASVHVMNLVRLPAGPPITTAQCINFINGINFTNMTWMQDHKITASGMNYTPSKQKPRPVAKHPNRQQWRT